MHLVGIIEMYKELILTAKEVGEHFGRSVVTWWHHGMAPWWNGASARGISCTI